MHTLRITLIITFLITALSANGSDNYCDLKGSEPVLEETSARTTYNKACCEATKNNTDDAFYYLKLAVSKGYRNHQWMSNDTDLLNLHDDKRWRETINLVIENEKQYLSTINVELYHIYKDDQDDRKSKSIDWEAVSKKDEGRRKRVLELLKSGLLLHSDDYYHAAMIFQHGGNPLSYKQAHELAIEATKLSPANKKARWLACASEDRYLQSIGKPQVWGTQYQRKDAHSPWTIEPIDKTVKTDLERKQWGVPILEETLVRLKNMNQ
jgi:hypothetical protein